MKHKHTKSVSYGRRHRLIKSFEAKAKAERTRAEWLADMITVRVGTIEFFIVNALWFLIWIGINIGIIPGVPRFDPFPFGLLTMIVSLEAIFLSIIVLISQNRAAKTDALREEIDLQINTISEEEITKIIQLLLKLMEHHHIRVPRDTNLKEMIKPTDTKKIEQSIEQEIEEP